MKQGNEELAKAGWGLCELCGEPIERANEMLWLTNPAGTVKMLIHRRHTAQILVGPVDECANLVIIVSGDRKEPVE